LLEDSPPSKFRFGELIVPTFARITPSVHSIDIVLSMSSPLNDRHSVIAHHLQGVKLKPTSLANKSLAIVCLLYPSMRDRLAWCGKRSDLSLTSQEEFARIAHNLGALRFCEVVDVLQ